MSDDTDSPGLRGRHELWRGAIGSFGLDDVVLPNGARREMAVIRHPGAAAVVPFADRDTVLLLRQYRHAAGCTLWEVPAGKLDDGEDPAVCVARELEEETGHVAGHIEPLGRVHTAPGFTDEVIHLYAAFELSPGTLALEPGEVIETVTVAFDDALAMLDRGEITDAKTVAALMFALRRFR